MGGFINQRDYDLICEILQSGAPALANNLIAKLSNTVNDWQRLRKAEQDSNDAQPENIQSEADGDTEK